MPMSFSGDGIITGLVAGGLPNNTVITDDIVNASVTAAKIASGVLGASLQVFASNGTYTPTAGKNNFLVFATGGGGGGGGATTGFEWAGGTGGAGGTAIRMYTLTEMGASAAIVIGTGGAGGSQANGTAGTATTFDPAGTGLTITGSGGSPGARTVSGSLGGGGAGGGATNGQLNITGGGGVRGIIGSAAPSTSYGGSSFWGYSPGAGGPTGVTAGYSGSNGVIFILEF